MINTVLSFLQQDISRYIDVATANSPDESIVALSAIANDAGKYAIAENKVGLSLINIEEDKIFRTQVPDRKEIAGQFVQFQPDVKIDLTILFAARFGQYDEALKNIAKIILYFQSRPVFTNTDYPALKNIQRIIPEMQSLGFEQLNQVWAYIGAKYLPSVVYKLRLLVMQEETVDTLAPAVQHITANMHSR